MAPSEESRTRESRPSDPEALAKLVLRCREFSAYLDDLAPRLPQRAETPFLYGQLDDVVRKLQAALQRFGTAERPGDGSSLLRRLTGRKRAEPANKETRIDLQGNAWTIPVTEVVNFLSHSAKTGVLSVTTSQETFLLEFFRGNLVHATSSCTPEDLRLGEILVRLGTLQRDELVAMLERAKSADDLLGSHLVSSGRMQKHHLQRALSVQVQELFHRLMDAENAIYRFQDGVQMLRSQELTVNITQLLLESARKKDEQRAEITTKTAPRAPEAATGSEPTTQEPAKESAKKETKEPANKVPAKDAAPTEGKKLPEAKPVPASASRPPPNEDDDDEPSEDVEAEEAKDPEEKALRPGAPKAGESPGKSESPVATTEESSTEIPDPVLPSLDKSPPALPSASLPAALPEKT